MAPAFPGLSIERVASGDATVGGKLRLADRRIIDANVEVPGGEALADEELAEAALALLRQRHPGARWVDAKASAATAALTGERRPAAWLFRFPLYLLLWTLLIAPASFGIERVFREAFIVPACTAWGNERNVVFASYSHGGGHWTDLFNVTGSYSPQGCYFTGGHPNFATLREIGGERFSRIAALGGASTVFAAIVLTTIVVVLLAAIVERVLRLRRGAPRA